MSRVPIETPPGIVSDDTSFATPGRYADGSNVRFWRGKAQVIGGWESLVADTLGGICRTAFPWTDNDANLHVAFGTHATLEVHVDGALYDITPAGLAAGPIDGGGGSGYGTGTYSTGDYSEPSLEESEIRTWSLAAWGEQLLACPRGNTIYLWTNNTASPATALSNAPAQVTFMLVSNTRQVFALGCSEEVGGSFNPLCIRHSSIGDNNDWATTSSSTAREYTLPGGGRIVGGRLIGSYMLVWTTYSLFLGTFVGSLEQPWRFDKVGDKCGLIGPNAAVVVGQGAYWLGPDFQFRAYQLGGAVSIIDCPIREALADNFAEAQEAKVVASSISTFDEIRFDYPDSRDGNENSRYLAAHVPTLNNSPENAWYRGEMARTSFVDAGPPPDPIGVDADSAIYWHERGQSANGGALEAFIETSDMFLSEDYTGLVRCMWPDMSGQVGAVSATVKTRLKPQADDAERSQTVAMAPGDDKLDFRLHGRLFKLRLESNSAPSYWRLGRPVVDFVKAGMR